MPKQDDTRQGDGLSKKKILALASRLFRQKGYYSVSMRDLALACGCKPASLYNYFKTKESILFEVLLSEMEDIIRPISHLEEQDGDPAEQLRLVIHSHLKVALSHRRSPRMLHDAALASLAPANRKVIVALRDAHDRILRSVIERGQRKGLFLPLDAKLVSFMIDSMISRTRLWFLPNKGLTLNELSDFIFGFALRSIQAKKGLAK
ncbi:MAG: TetR/AcrR family transcriptional regulator [Desulfomonile tiedjei]|nr:TetR/AcrR family transcriptional regulator [Desulfomonile tiedjei]